MRTHIQLNNLVTRRRMLLIGCLLILGVVAWRNSAYQRGKFVAYMDNSQARYRVKDYGFPSEWLGEYANLLQSRYGVELDTVAGCVVTEQLVEFVKGYNEVSVPAIEAAFGKNIFAECREDARNRWELEHPQEIPQ